MVVALEQQTRLEENRDFLDLVRKAIRLRKRIKITIAHIQAKIRDLDEAQKIGIFSL